jgi:glycine C-acetyltransferase
LAQLAREFGALLFVDESHASGVLGQTGRGTPEELVRHGQIDVITGTFGKALGGASGGFIAGRRELIEFLRQKSRPYTFSNTVPPAVVTASIAAIDLIESDPAIVTRCTKTPSISAARSCAQALPFLRAIIRLCRLCWAKRRWRRR